MPSEFETILSGSARQEPDCSVTISRSQVVTAPNGHGAPCPNSDELDANRALRRDRLVFLYKISTPILLFYCIQALLLRLTFTLILDAITFTFFFLSLRTLYEKEDITRASWQFLIGFTVLIGLTPLVDYQIRSSVIWMIPLIPVIAAHLLGSKAALCVAGGTTTMVIGTWISTFYWTIPPEHHFKLFDKVLLHLFSLLIASGLGLSAVRTAKRQAQKIRAHEQDLRKAQSAIESARRAKALFLANMSHEIRTPLNGILGMTKLLEDASPGPEDAKAIQSAQTCGQALLELLNRVLDLSKIEAEKLSLRPAPICLSQLGSELLAAHSPQFASSQVQLRLDLDFQGLWGLADRTRILQLLTIFLDHARTHRRAATVTLGGVLGPTLAGNPGLHRLCWTIEDDGVPLEAELLTRLTGEAHGGIVCEQSRAQAAGIGFALALGLVNLMGGLLRLDGSLARGLRVLIELPLQIIDAPESSTPNKSPDLPCPQDSKPLRVLLVDDNRINRLIASRTLTERNCLVTQAEHGAMAVDLASSEPFDLILMDLQMPVMDGFEASRKIVGHPGPNQATWMVALTAGDYDDHAARIAQSGMRGFLTKPFELLALDQVLQTARSQAQGQSDVVLHAAQSS